MILNYKKYPIAVSGRVRYESLCNYWNIYDFEDRDYWYVEIKDILSFTDKILDEIIPESVVRSIQTGDIKLVINNSFESFHSMVDLLYKKIIIERKIPEESLIFFSESINIAPVVKRVASEFNKKPIRTFCPQVSEYSVSVDIIKTLMRSTKKHPTVENKKFLLTNRRWRPHRPAIVALLCAKGVLDQGYVSLIKDDNNWNNIFDWLVDLNCNNKQITDLLVSNKNTILNLPTLNLDKTDDQVVNFFQDYYDYCGVREDLIPYYRATYFSVVTETYFYKNLNETLSFTEKVFQPMVYKHPFVLLARYQSLHYLKIMGYKTFHPYVNEEYDLIENDADRLLAIANEIERLCKLTPEEIQSFKEGCQKICEYNYQVLLHRLTKPKIKLT